MSHSYPRNYPAVIVRWVDGDTVDLDVDLGFHMHGMLRFRLFGLNTPERGQPGWTEATARANELAPPGSHVTAITRKDGDKYGRWLAWIHPQGANVSVNDVLISEGLAVPYL